MHAACWVELGCPPESWQVHEQVHSTRRCLGGTTGLECDSPLVHSPSPFPAAPPLEASSCGRRRRMTRTVVQQRGCETSPSVATDVPEARPALCPTPPLSKRGGGCGGWLVWGAEWHGHRLLRHCDGLNGLGRPLGRTRSRANWAGLAHAPTEPGVRSQPVSRRQKGRNACSGRQRS